MRAVTYTFLSRAIFHYHMNVILPNEMQPEKCFFESSKIWLAQQKFLFKYASMEILFEVTKKILLISFL